MDTSRDLPMSDENIAMIISAAEKECSERAKNKRPEMSIYDLEKRINATIPEYMRVPIMDTLCEMAEDARRQARRYAELNARIAYIRRHTKPPKGETECASQSHIWIED